MSYKVVIIDDNQNTVQSLKYGIEWERLDLEVVGTAFDGQQGKEIIEKTEPDIIITDIHMPYMDGLTMAETALTMMPDSKVIVITGYDNIQYATRAIRLSVFDYILKPIDDNELLAALQRAVKTIRENKSAKGKQNGILRERLISGLLSGQNFTVNELLKDVYGQQFCSMFVASLEGGFSQAFLQKAEYSKTISQGYYLAVALEEKLAVLCTAEERSEDWEQYLKSFHLFLKKYNPKIQIGKSRIYGTDVFLKKIYIEAYEDMVSRSVENREKSYPVQAKNHVSVADMQAEVTKLAKEISGSKDYEKTCNVFKHCTGGSMISLQIMTIMYCTKVIQTHKQWSKALEPTIFKATQNMTPEMFGEWLKGFLEVIDRIQEEDKGKSQLILKMLHYMEEHALDNIKLEQMAAEFYMSPNYLSSLIRKETGITFQQHILNNKIAIAKKLLDDTGMRVEEIAHIIGYENYVSFYNIFKRLEGITPSEYRFRRKE